MIISTRCWSLNQLKSASLRVFEWLAGSGITPQQKQQTNDSMDSRRVVSTKPPLGWGFFGILGHLGQLKIAFELIKTVVLLTEPLTLK